MKRLKTKEIAPLRDQMLKEQNGLCGLQQIPVERGQEVLDHDHIDGRVRTVLSRNANAIEGRILNLIGRLKGRPDPVEFLQSLIDYWETDYSDKPLHPTHKLDEEIKRLKLKRKLKKLKMASAKERTKAEIKILDEIIKEKLS